MTELPYVLPTMLGDQYMLIKLKHKASDYIVYAAQQVEIRRDVTITSMLRTITDSPEDAAFFLESARVMSRFISKRVGSVLELILIDDRWHMVQESIKGESLDTYLARGEKFSPLMMARFLRSVFRLSIWMDIRGVATREFNLSHCYLIGNDFRFDNPAIAGYRLPYMTRDLIRHMAEVSAPLLDEEKPGATYIKNLLSRMIYLNQWRPLTALEFTDALLHFQAEQVRAGIE